MTYQIDDVGEGEKADERKELAYDVQEHGDCTQGDGGIRSLEDVLTLVVGLEMRTMGGSGVSIRCFRSDEDSNMFHFFHTIPYSGRRALPALPQAVPYTQPTLLRRPFSSEIRTLPLTV